MNRFLAFAAFVVIPATSLAQEPIPVVGEPEFAVAAGRAAAVFREAGLKPMGDSGSYFQRIEKKAFRANPTFSHLAIGDERFAIGSGLQILASEKDVRVSGRPLLLRAWNAAAPPDIAGRIVVARESQGSIVDRMKGRGALAILVVSDKQGVPMLPDGGWRTQLDSNEVRAEISTALSDRLGFPAGATSQNSAEPIEGSQIVSLQIEVEQRSLVVINVLGMLEGSSPKLKHETVALGANLGRLPGEQVAGALGPNPGVRSVAVLERVVKQITFGKRKLGRSALFALWASRATGTEWLSKATPEFRSSVQAYLSLDSVELSRNLRMGELLAVADWKTVSAMARGNRLNVEVADLRSDRSALSILRAEILGRGDSRNEDIGELLSDLSGWLSSCLVWLGNGHSAPIRP